MLSKTSMKLIQQLSEIKVDNNIFLWHNKYVYHIPINETTDIIIIRQKQNNENTQYIK